MIVFWAFHVGDFLGWHQNQRDKLFVHYGGWVCNKFCNNQTFNVKCLKINMINFQIGHNHLNGFLPCFHQYKWDLIWTFESSH